MFKTRYYNQIILQDNIIIKKSSVERLGIEHNRFENAKKYISKFIPSFVNLDLNLGQLEMEYVKKGSLYEAINSGTIELNTHLFQKLYYIHKALINNNFEVDYKQSITDYENMYYQKPIDSINDFIENHSIFSIENIYIKINGISCKHPIIILENLFRKIIKPNHIYSLIHGDLTLSNILVGDNNDFKLIDPRGKFGNTMMFGDFNYDIAKLYYSIFGNFDFLNNNEFDYKKININEYEYKINEYKIDNNLEKNFFEIFTSDINTIKYIHSTIRLSLMGHMNDSIEQKYVCFLKGTFLLNQLIKNNE